MKKNQDFKRKLQGISCLYGDHTTIWIAWLVILRHQHTYQLPWLTFDVVQNKNNFNRRTMPTLGLFRVSFKAIFDQNDTVPDTSWEVIFVTQLIFFWPWFWRVGEQKRAWFFMGPLKMLGLRFFRASVIGQSCRKIRKIVKVRLKNGKRKKKRKKQPSDLSRCHEEPPCQILCPDSQKPWRKFSKTKYPVCRSNQLVHTYVLLMWLRRGSRGTKQNGNEPRRIRWGSRMRPARLLLCRLSPRVPLYHSPRVLFFITK